MNGQQWMETFNNMPFEVLETTVNSMAKLPSVINTEFTGLFDVYQIAKEIYEYRSEKEGPTEPSMKQLKDASTRTGKDIKISHIGGINKADLNWGGEKDDF